MEENKVARITKHTEPSHPADSGVSGNAQTRAREIRAKEWLLKHHEDVNPNYLLPTSTPEWMSVAEVMDAYAESECSRLASRVEELREFLEWKVSHATMRINETTSFGHHHIPLTPQLNGYLQGERAEEKDAESPDLRVTLELARYEVVTADDGVKVMDRLTGAYIAWFRDGYLGWVSKFVDNLNSKEPK